LDPQTVAFHTTAYTSEFHMHRLPLLPVAVSCLM